jgi:hypothetical protein
VSNETGGTLSPPLQAGCLPAPSLSRVTRPEQVGSALEPSVNAARLLAGYRCAGSQRVQFQAAEARFKVPWRAKQPRFRHSHSVSKRAQFEQSQEQFRNPFNHEGFLHCGSPCSYAKNRT